MNGSVPARCDPEEITPTWLGEVLGLPVRDTTCERVGTGLMAMNFRYRLTLDGDAPEGAPTSVVAKLPADDETSRATGFNLGSYEREVRFYDAFAPSLAIRTPRCHLASYDADTPDFTLLLEDLAPARQGDQIAGSSLEQAGVAMDEVAALHGPRWNDRSLETVPWLARPPERGLLLPGPVPGVWPPVLRHLRQVPHARAAGARGAIRRRRGGLHRRLARPDHGRARRLSAREHDVRHTRLGLSAGRGRLADAGPGLSRCLDIAYFLGAGLLPEARREHERALLDRYRAPACPGSG